MKKVLSLPALFCGFLILLSFSVQASNLYGELHVRDSLRVKRTDGFKARVYQGRYKTQFWNIGKTNMTLRIEKNGAFIDVPINVAPSNKIPRNGAFTISATQSQQTFDSRGVTKTETQQSPTVRDFETCTYYREERVCRRRRYPRRPICRWETVEVYGEREVEFHYLTTKFDLNIEFQSSGNQPASFSGSQSNRRKVYTKRGLCY